MKGKKRIVLAEDHTILREGLRSLLAANPEFEIAAEAKDGFQAVKCVQNLTPDLLLLDLSLPGINGVEVIQEIKKRNPAT
ncbi:MAG: response regulator, partial [Spirochaetota bacterium]